MAQKQQDAKPSAFSAAALGQLMREAQGRAGSIGDGFNAFWFSVMPLDSLPNQVWQGRSCYFAGVAFALNRLNQQANGGGAGLSEGTKVEGMNTLLLALHAENQAFCADMRLRCTPPKGEA